MNGQDGSSREVAALNESIDNDLDTGSPGRFLQKKEGGLAAKKLHDAVREKIQLAIGIEVPLMAFVDGVWVDADRPLLSVVTELLRNDFLPSHVKNVIAMTRGRRDIPQIPDIPSAGCSRFINFTNGMLEWRTGKLYKHDPGLYSTNQLPHEWDPKAPEPTRFTQFLSEALDPDTHELAIEAIAYALYVGLPIKKAFMIPGPTDSGKSVFLGLVGDIVGDENASAVSLRQMATDRFVAAELRGVLVNIVADMSAANIADSALFKTATGGDIIRGERKHKDGFKFHARALHFFSVNEIPTSSDASGAFLNRWEILEFANSVPAEKQDRNLRAKLAAEIPGIVRIAIERLPGLIDSGSFADSLASQEMRSKAIEKMDPVRAFTTEMLFPDSEKRLARSDTYRAFHNWSRDSGYKTPLAARRFNERLPEAFRAVHGAEIEYQKLHGNRVWVGLTTTPGADTSRDTSGWIRPEEDPL